MRRREPDRRLDVAQPDDPYASGEPPDDRVDEHDPVWRRQELHQVRCVARLGHRQPQGTQVLADPEAHRVVPATPAAEADHPPAGRPAQHR